MKHSSDNQAVAENILKKILEATSVDIVSEHIEQRFACFMLNYNRQGKRFVVKNNKDFHFLISAFLNTIYHTEYISQELLLARGLFVIENFCQGHLGNGYEGIYYDLLNYTTSINDFLMIFVDGLKSYEQHRFVEVICLRHIDPCNHALKHALVKEISRKYGYYFQENLFQHPENLTPHIPKLIANIISSSNSFSQITNR